MEKEMLLLAEEYKHLRDQKAEFEKKLKEINAVMDTVESRLIDYMINNEMPSFTHSGVSYAVVMREYINAVPEQKPELYTRMRENGFEHLFSINSQTLQATVKELKYNNGDILPEWLNGLVTIYEKASLRLQAKK